MNKILLLTSDELKIATDKAALSQYIASLKGEGADMIATGVLDEERLQELSDAMDAATDRVAALDREAAIREKFASTTGVTENTSNVEDVVDSVDEKVDTELSGETIIPKTDVEVTETSSTFKVTVGSRALAAKVGSEITNAKQLGEAIVQAHRMASGTVSGRDETTYSKLFSVKTTFGLDTVWGQDEEANAISFKTIVQPSAVAAVDPSLEDSLVASGGYCKPLNTSYEIPFYAESCPTIDEFLPSVQTNDGGVKFLRPPSIASVLTDAAKGIAVITCEEDKAGYDCEVPAGPTPCKPTTKIACPTVDECCVDIITESVTFGTLNFRTFPTYVSFVMEAMAVAFNRKLNQYVLDKIDDPANSRLVTSSPVKFTPEADVLRDLLTIAARWRAENGKCCGSSNLKLALPCWMKDQFKINAIARGTESPAANIDDLLRSEGFDVFWYEGSATGANQTLAPQMAGAVVPLPVKAVGYLFAPDTFTVLRGGDLNFGLVRDSKLNHANNLEIMSETFIGVCRTGSMPAFKIEFTICPDGAPIGELNGVLAPC